MSLPEHVRRCWWAMDALLARVEPAPWGAVVADPRFPLIWDANHARIDRWPRGCTLADVEERLLPAMRTTGAPVEHVVSLVPERTAALFAELATRGHRLSWDVVLDHAGRPPATDGPSTVELPDEPATWERVAASFALFGIQPEGAVRQLLALERDVLAPAGKRWFGVRNRRGVVVSLGALLVAEGVGYVDGVATFPRARRRGYASALVARIVREARSAGARRVWLLADPEAPEVVRMYARLGFREVARIGSTRGPLPAQSTNL